MKTILITGSSGCIGSACVEYFARNGWDVVATSRRASEVELPGVQYEYLDLAIPGNPKSLVERYRPSHLLHIAWHMSAGNWQVSGDDDFLKWVGITTELVLAFKLQGGVKAVCMGSATEYDWHCGVLSEDSPRRPSTMYGVAKSCAGELLVEYCRRVELPFVWARLFFMYGGNEAQNRLVPSIIKSLLEGKEAHTSDGKQVRDFLYVEDVAASLNSLINSDLTGPVNVGSGVGVPLHEIISLLGELTDRSDLLRMGARPQAIGDTPLVVADTTKLKGIGFVPSYTLEGGLEATIKYWKSKLELS